jgi:DHA3 family macrolide efflux protein-like MFS transporter
MSYQPPKHGFRTFIIMWVTQAISVLGSYLSGFAINIWLTQTKFPLPEQKPQLAAALSAMAVSRGLPWLLMGPVAGAFADRHDRRRTMIAANLAEGLLTLVTLALMVTGRLEVWMLVGLNVLFTIAGTFHFAAFDTSYAMLLDQNQLPRANGMMQMLWSVSGIVAPGIAATIIALPSLGRQGALGSFLGGWLGAFKDGSPLAITLDAISFFQAALVLLFLSIPSPKRKDLKGEAKPSILADVKAGALYIWQRRPMLWLLGTFAVTNLFGGIGIYTPLLVKFNLQPDWAARGFSYETALAFVNTAASLGGVMGGLLISTWGGLKQHRVLGVVVPMMINGVAMMGYGWSAGIYLSAVAIFVSQAMIPIMNSHSQAIWQSQTPRELQGRVFSVRRVLAQFTSPVNQAMSGYLGGRFNPGSVVATYGAIVFVFSSVQFFNPYLRRVDDREWIEKIAAGEGG